MKKFYFFLFVFIFSATSLVNAQLIISEFRVRGPNGANDEFIEIYNNSGADHTVAGGGTGYAIVASNGVARGVIPNGTVIPNRGHYLFVNSVGYSLASYPAGNGTTATGDATYTSDIPDNAGIALFNTSVPGDFTLANRMDAVGSTAEANTLYKEGAGYPNLTPFSIDYSFQRRTSPTGSPQDTNSNAGDFEFNDTNGTSAGAGQRLGAPGPENLSSPLKGSGTLLVTRLDQSVSATSPPNMVRDFTSDPANNSTFGTLDLRYRITNQTGGAVTRIRFRIDSIWTFPAPSGFADLRPRTSTAVVIAGINDAATCAPGAPPCIVTVQGTTLEQPPSQPNGGGFNSSMSAGTVTLATPLANGASMNIRLLFGIQQNGIFTLEFGAEMLPGGGSGPVKITGHTLCTPPVGSASNQTICSGATTSITLSSDQPATTYSYTAAIQTAPSGGTITGFGPGTANPIAQTLTNTGTTPGVVRYTVIPTASGCDGSPFTVDVTVNPLPDGTATPATQTICSGSPITTIALTSTTPGATFSWSRNNTVNVTGIPSNGFGDISGTLTNTTNAIQTVTFTATPASGFGTCSGTQVTATVIVVPIPTVNAISNQTVCNNALTAAVNFTGAVANTIYTWTNNTPSIGLAASGSGNIGPFTAINTGTTPVTATITVTPTINSNFTSNTLSFTGAVQTWVVPAGVTSINIQAFGAQGNNNGAGVVRGGLGGLATGNLAVTPGETLWIYVGGGATTSTTGGFNGGGNGGTTGSCLTATGGGGGGASDVRQGANNIASRRIVGAGGGGTAGNRVAGCSRGAGGGGGGGYYGGGGGSGYPGTTGIVPTGGTQSAGGAGGITGTTFGATNGGPGSLATGGTGGNEAPSNQGGSLTVTFNSGNGGGLTGAPGTQSGANNFTGQGGAGGSSYVGGVTDGSTSPGVRTGNGQVIISYIAPGPATICTGTPRTFTITVNPSPTISCPSNISVTSAPGQCGAVVIYPAATATGTPAPVITYSHASGSFFPGGVTTVTATATNSCGTATCTFTVTVIDNQPPTITCPAPITVSNTPNLCSAVVTYPFPTIADNCPFPGSPVTLTQSSSNTITSLASVSCNSGGLHTDNSYWRAYDLGPLNLTGPLTINTVTFGIELANASGTGTTQPVTVRIHTSAGAFPGGVRTLVASQTFNVPDQTLSLYTATLTTPPTVAANAILVLEIFTPSGQAAGHSFFIGSNTQPETGPSYISAAACGIPNPATTASIGFPNMHIVLNAAGLVSNPALSTVQTAGFPSGGVFPVGTTTNTFVVTDMGGNTATCSFTVTVNDTQAPTVLCPANITVTTPITSCTAIVTYAVTGADNCPGVTTQLVSGPASGSAFPIGVTTVTWRAVDAAGNVSANCSFTVTVLDGQLPVISSQPANQTVCVGTPATFSVVSTFASSYQWQSWNGTAWVNITGATASSYTISNVTHAMNTNSFRVRITGPCGSVTTSNHASLYVNALPTITITSNIQPQLLPGQFITLTATGTPGGGTFVWRKNGAVIAGATSSTLGPLNVLDVGTYTVTYTDANGCVSTSANFVISALLSEGLYIYPNPNTGQFHVRFFNAVNEEATITVYNYLGAIVYQQKHMTGPLQYSIIDVDLGDRLAIGTYVVDVRNAQGRRIAAKLMSIGRK